MSVPKITHLEISCNGGMELEDNFCYSISADDEGCHLFASLNSGNITKEKDISKRAYDKLIRLFDGVDLASWDDSDYVEKDGLPDAVRFTFTASFSDGTTCVAHSVANAPKGYKEAEEAFISKFKRKTKRVKPSD